MIEQAVIVIGLLVLSVVSGMLGLGVAFAAVPFLGLFFDDLVHQVQPLSLLLNGLTGLASTIGFARSGHVAWRRALILAAVTTVFAPIGAELAHRVPPAWIWSAYFLSAAYMAYRLLRPVQERPGQERFGLAVGLAIPISILSGFLGVGPGFLLLPTLILVGFGAKQAAGINAFAITPPSFSALGPHLQTAQFDPRLTTALLVVGVLGSYGGARLASLRLSNARMKQAFGLLLVLVTSYKLFTLIR